MASIYEEIGGEQTLAKAVDSLFARAEADPLLKLYFDGRDVAKIKRGFNAYVARLLRGQQPADGPSLHVLHRGTEISDMGFDVFVDYFLEALKAEKVSENGVAAVKSKLLPLKNEVVDSFAWTGKHFYAAR